MIKYLLQGFGYRDGSDLADSLFCPPVSATGTLKIFSLSAVLGAVRMFIEQSTGLDIAVFFAFVILVMMEFHSGLKVARRIRGERFKSRKFGRMIVKVGVYMGIITLLHAFAQGVTLPPFLGYDVQPFMWLYYSVFIGIVFQLVISWMENLALLGYSEAKTIAGAILRRLNKWFEFDGTKDNGTE